MQTALSEAELGSKGRRQRREYEGGSFWLLRGERRLRIAFPGSLLTNEENFRLPIGSTATFIYKQDRVTSSNPLREAMNPTTQATLMVPPICFWSVSGPFTGQSGHYIKLLLASWTSETPQVSHLNPRSSV